MRYDTPIYFQFPKPAVFNAETGNYDTPEPDETMVYANVTDVLAQEVTMGAGKLYEGAKVIRLQQHVDSGYSTIRIGDRVYCARSSRTLSNKQTITAYEVE